MDVAIVTGASSGLGLAISRRLVEIGFKVYGFGGNYAEVSWTHSGFIPVPCDLSDPVQLEEKVELVLKKEGAVCVVVNNAKQFAADDLESVSVDRMQRSLNINLLCPMILAKLTLPGLRRLQGYIINISSAMPETSRGVIGAASAGGLSWMSEVLFQTVRDHGVRVSAIFPEPNRWRPADSGPRSGNNKDTTSSIDPEFVAQAVLDAVLNKSGNVATEIVVRPQRYVEKASLPPREIPYPKPQPIPYTTPKEVIEAEEAEELEQFLQRKRDKRENREKRRQEQRSEERDAAAADAPASIEPETQSEPELQPEPAAPQTQTTAASDAPSSETSGRPRRRRRGRKPRPLAVAENAALILPEPILEKLKQPVVQARREVRSISQKQSIPTPAPTGQVPAKATAEPKETTAQKAVVKKAPVQKVAAEKAAAKKAPVKKAATKKAAVRKAATKKVTAKKAAIK